MAFRLGVDVGGTFTDLFLVNDADDRQFRVLILDVLYQL